ncbi:MAG: hypothetical protein Q4D60_04775 [Eubacteriales bacterium]|nr:hypothetical protein [Eubacteriales bacterium]
MYLNLLFSHFQNELTETYFEICRYFIITQRSDQADDCLRLDYYKSLILISPVPSLSPGNKLDLEIISSSMEVRKLLLNIYPAEFILEIIYSGLHGFFDKMEKYAAVDVQLRSVPELHSFFTAMTPIIIERLHAIIDDICDILPPPMQA